MGNVRKYKFSVIMPIYNVDKYLREAIDSIASQTIGFKKNIQLILVNDGSTDNSGQICREYLNEYPENIIFIDKENQGVSAARNEGIPHIEGKYVNFFDSDDIWEKDAFEKAWDFFEQHSDEVDLICCREILFEGKTGEHNLSKKFKNGSRIIDINEEPNHILLSVKSAFIKADAASKYEYDTRISIGEDSKYVTQIILDKEKYGVLDSTHYNFRKRLAATSITQNPKLGRYTDTVELYYKYMLDHSMERYGKLMPYIQHAVINGLKNRVVEQPKDFMTQQQWAAYTDRIIELIRRIDDEIIAGANNTQLFTKLYILRLKYGEDISKEIYIKNKKLCFRDIPLARLPLKAVVIDEMTVSWGKVTFAGIVNVPMNDNIGIFVKEKGKYTRLETTPDDRRDRRTFTGEVLTRCHAFKASVRKKDADMSFYLGGNGKYVKIEGNSRD